MLKGQIFHFSSYVKVGLNLVRTKASCGKSLLIEKYSEKQHIQRLILAVFSTNYNNSSISKQKCIYSWLFLNCLISFIYFIVWIKWNVKIYDEMCVGNKC